MFVTYLAQMPPKIYKIFDESVSLMSIKPVLRKAGRHWQVLVKY